MNFRDANHLAGFKYLYANVTLRVHWFSIDSKCDLFTSRHLQMSVLVKSPPFGVHDEDKVKKHTQCRNKDAICHSPNIKDDPFASIQDAPGRYVFLSCLEKILCYECISCSAPRTEFFIPGKIPHKLIFGWAGLTPPKSLENTPKALPRNHLHEVGEGSMCSQKPISERKHVPALQAFLWSEGVVRRRFNVPLLVNHITHLLAFYFM